jgi:hypothetical protein
MLQIPSELRSPSTLVLLVGPYISIIAEALFQDAESVGSITVPELRRLRSPLELEYGTANKHQHITHVSKASLGNDDEGILVGCMKRLLPEEQAVTWADAVLSALNPRSVIVVSSILAMEYRGPGDPANEDLVFAMHNTHETTVPDVSCLPPSTPLAGVPAALLQRCELGGGSQGLQPRAAAAIVAVEHAQVPQASLICRAAAALAGKLKLHLPTMDARAQIAACLDATYRSSAGNSMFI